MINFNPQKALSLISRIGTSALFASNGVPPEMAAMAGEGVGAVVEGLSYERKAHTPADVFHDAVIHTIATSLKEYGLEIDDEFVIHIADSVFSKDVIGRLSWKNAEFYFAEKIESEFYV